MTASTLFQLLGNIGFETGIATPWTLTAGVLCGNTGCAGETAHAGAWFAWLDGYGRAHTDSATQSVVIPAGKTSATLVLYLSANNALIEAVQMFRGTLTQTSVYPRELVKGALERNAARRWPSICISTPENQAPQRTTRSKCRCSTALALYWRHWQPIPMSMPPRDTRSRA